MSARRPSPLLPALAQLPTFLRRWKRSSGLWIEDCVETSLSHDELDRIAVRLDIDAEAFEDRAYFYDDTYIHVDDLYDVIDAILDFAYSVDRDSIQQLLDDSLS